MVIPIMLFPPEESLVSQFSPFVTKYISLDTCGVHTGDFYNDYEPSDFSQDYIGGQESQVVI